LLVAHVFVVIIILQCRPNVADPIRAPQAEDGPFAMMRNRPADIGHMLAIVSIWRCGRCVPPGAERLRLCCCDTSSLASAWRSVFRSSASRLPTVANGGGVVAFAGPTAWVFG
jgi:hypothetical protein